VVKRYPVNEQDYLKKGLFLHDGTPKFRVIIRVSAERQQTAIDLAFDGVLDLKFNFFHNIEHWSLLILYQNELYWLD
jgi:hypothetical protein